MNILFLDYNGVIMDNQSNVFEQALEVLEQVVEMYNFNIVLTTYNYSEGRKWCLDKLTPALANRVLSTDWHVHKYFSHETKHGKIQEYIEKCEDLVEFLVIDDQMFEFEGCSDEIRKRLVYTSKTSGLRSLRSVERVFLRTPYKG